MRTAAGGRWGEKGDISSAFSPLPAGVVDRLLHTCEGGEGGEGGGFGHLLWSVSHIMLNVQPPEGICGRDGQRAGPLNDKGYDINCLGNSYPAVVRAVLYS